MNLFKIYDLKTYSVDQFNSLSKSAKVIYSGFRSDVEAAVELHCNEHGRLLGKFVLRATATGNTQTEAQKNCLQKLLNHEYYTDRQIHIPTCGCDPEFKGMVYTFTDWHEPYKSLFESLFEGSDWTIQKAIC